MHMDGIALFASVRELKDLLTNGRIERITQPKEKQLIFFIRNNRQTYRLCISADSEFARLHIAEDSKPSPDTPYPFLMVLRKYLLKGRIQGFALPYGLERVIRIDILSPGELGDLQLYHLYCEVMSSSSNIILVEEKTILDCITRVPAYASSHRTLLPHQPYLPPVPQDKQNPLLLSKAEFLHALQQAENNNLSRTLVMLFDGISPFSARQIVAKVGLEDDKIGSLSEKDLEKLADAITAFFYHLQNKPFSPQLLYHNQNPFGYFPFEAIGYQNISKDSFQKALDSYYEKAMHQKVHTQLSSALLRPVNNQLTRLEKRLALHKEALLNEDNATKYQRYGELLLAYVHQIPPRQKTATVFDYYEEKEIEIPLDSTKSVVENAENYFKEYTKSQSTTKHAKLQLAEIEPEIAYLESLQLNIEYAETVEELEQIKEELSQQQLLPRKGKKSQDMPSQPLRLLSSDQIEILVGRNNAQNDLITTRVANSLDTFLHVQGMPGSHVIIRSKNVPPKTLQEAAMAAAFFSRARKSSNVPIDYTFVKHVRKPSGSKPGFVIYTQQKTIFITPDEAHVKSLIQPTA